MRYGGTVSTEPGWLVRAGAPDSCVVVHVPHSSRELPPDVRETIVLDDADLAVELDRMTDVDTDILVEQAAAAVPSRPWVLQNRLSRLVVDPERFADEREEMRAVGMGAVYTRTSDGRPLRGARFAGQEALLRDYFRPYAAAMTVLVDQRIAVTGRAVIVDVHSYPARPLPYELHADGARPAICLGTDAFHTPASLVAAAEEIFSVVGDVGRDSPFAGCYVPQRHYRRDRRVTALMVEIRRDTYAEVVDRDRIVAALTHLLAFAGVE